MALSVIMFWKRATTTRSMNPVWITASNSGTDIYHPMLVNGEPSNVKISYHRANGKEYGMLKESEQTSILIGWNVLRGNLKMKKP